MENQSLALLRGVLLTNLDEKDLKIEITRLRSNETDDLMGMREMVEQLFKTLGGLLGKLEDPWLKGLTLEQFNCQHKWAWEEGCSSTIGCGCKLN
jgi:hypothetical protein